MTRKQLGSTLESMQARRALLCLLLPLGFACRGSYVLGDAGDATPGLAGQGGEPNAAGAGVAGWADEQAGQTGEGGLGAGGRDGSGLTLSPTSLPTARLNRGYLTQFSADGGVEPYAFSLASGQLPPGLELETGGLLHGAPSAAGDFELVIRATDADGTRAESALVLSVSRVRWLASNTFPSSASAQTLLSLTDLLDPDAQAIRIESQSAHGARFSPDGRWLLYHSFRSVEESDWYIVDTSGALPSERHFLLTSGSSQACDFSPGGSRLACLKQVDGDGALVYFATSGAELGPARELATAERFAWVNADTIVFGGDSAAYRRLSWDAGVPGEPQPVGPQGMTIEQQSADGRRAIVSVAGSEGPPLLLDLLTGESAPLPDAPGLTLADDFAVAVSFAPVAGEPDKANYRFYSISGVSWSQVGETEASLHTSYSPYQLPLLGNRLVLVKQDRVSLAVIDDAGFDELVVPGAFTEVRSVAQAASGRWLYIETGQRSGSVNFSPETIRHWLSRVEGEEPAQLVAEGFLSSGPAFSPDSQRFRLHGVDSHSASAVPFYLFELSDPARVETHELDVPLNWAHSSWSEDSSFLSFLGGSPTLQSRILFAVDALAPDTAPRTIFECSQNPAPLPGCPNSAVFQP